MKRVCVVGISPGQKTLPPEAAERLTKAGLVVGSGRLLALAPDCAAEKIAVEGRVSEVVERVAANPELNVVFLASGDPGFFGIGATLVKKMGAEEVEIIPAVSSLQAAFAKIGEPWSDARFASLHGRSFDALLPLLGSPRIGLLTDAENNPAKIASFLDDAGWGGLSMAVCSNIGEDGEKAELGKVADFSAWSGPSLNVVILLNREGDERPLGPGLPEELFLHPRGRITKSFVRAAALAMLELPRRGVLWDIGAGSGSVGIEASLLSPGLKVCAIERDEEALGHMRENRKRFRAAQVSVVAGGAPEALLELPAPDRVFIGGSGGRLSDILSICHDRLPAGGVTVVSTVLAETFHDTLAWAKANRRTPEWAELQVGKSKPTGAGTRLAAQDPVTLIKLTKEA